MLAAYPRLVELGVTVDPGEVGQMECGKWGDGPLVGSPPAPGDGTPGGGEHRGGDDVCCVKDSFFLARRVMEGLSLPGLCVPHRPESRADIWKI